MCETTTDLSEQEQSFHEGTEIKRDEGRAMSDNNQDTERLRLAGSRHKVTSLRAAILTILGMAAFVGIVSQIYMLAALSICLFLILLGVYASKEAYDYVERKNRNFLLIEKVTQKVPIEIMHSGAEKRASSIVMQIQTQRLKAKQWIALTDYQNSKVENQNIAIYGMNGTGKSTLGQHLLEECGQGYQIVLFSPKSKDTGSYRRIVKDKIDMSRFRPDPWQNKKIFKRAVLVTINIELSGITADYIEPLVNGIIDDSNNWDELFLTVKLRIEDKTNDTIRRGAFLRIQEAFKAIYDPQVQYFEIPHGTSVMLDYSTVEEIKATFDSEFCLGLLFDDIIHERRRNLIIYIDEAHRLLCNKYASGKNVSIIEQIVSREIRATGSRLWICTQSYQDISPTARDQFNTQYIFKTKEPDTMTDLKVISELLDQAVVDLDPYCFVDIGQDFIEAKVRDAVYHFKLYPRTIDESLPPGPQPTSQEFTPVPSKPIQQQTTGKVPSTPLEVVQQQPVSSPNPSGHLMEVVELLENDAMFTKEVATEIARFRYKPADADESWEPSEDEVRAIKLFLTDRRIFMSLVSIHDCRFAGVVAVQDRYREKPQSLYYLKQKGEQRVHNKLMSLTRLVLAEKEKTILYEGKNHSPASEVDFVIDGFVIEVETSLKRGNVKDLAERVSRANKRVVIVVPNDETKERYEHLAKSPKYKHFFEHARYDIVVFYNLGYFLDNNSPTSANDLSWDAKQTVA